MHGFNPLLKSSKSGWLFIPCLEKQIYKKGGGKATVHPIMTYALGQKRENIKNETNVGSK